MNFQQYIESHSSSGAPSILVDKGDYLVIPNTGKDQFLLRISDVGVFLTVFLDNFDALVKSMQERKEKEREQKAKDNKSFSDKIVLAEYDEKPFRELFQQALNINPKLLAFNSLGRSQTLAVVNALSTIIGYLSDTTEWHGTKQTGITREKLQLSVDNFRTDAFKLAGSVIPSEESINLKKQAFIEWMQNPDKQGRTLSTSTIRQYANSGIRVADEFLSDTVHSESSLYEVNKAIDVKNFLLSVSKLNKWKTKNDDHGSLYSAAVSKYIAFLEDEDIQAKTKPKSPLPKPFLLLAGISGTGKTRFVKEQADLNGEDTYCIVPVRPDWHEPSDLLGHVSRLGANGAEYVATDVLRFIVKAWLEITPERVGGKDENGYWQGKPLQQIRPFWLCLDEMNLAPVEQYFADYLSVLETRKLTGGSDNYEYRCAPLLSNGVFVDLGGDDLKGDGLQALRESLELDSDEHQHLWDQFCEHGIALPFNLIVAGTVNMGETTHGFSRKVIDRALTIDFGEFFPNDFAQFFSPTVKPVALTYPSKTSVSAADELPTIDKGEKGSRSITFLQAVNDVLTGTPFELAFRALNELLLAVESAAPDDERTLQAVWDDFLMFRVLPRIEGDRDKLASLDDSNANLLAALSEELETQLGKIWGADLNRPDLLQQAIDGGEAPAVACRSKAKIEWMEKRLQSGFTSFWP